jgi:MSHA biogenesis protein MshJ
MLRYWQQVNQYYLALSLRERSMVGVALAVAISVLWYMLLIDPMHLTGQASESELTKLQTTLRSLRLQQQALQLKQQQDPLRELKARVAQLNQHLLQADAQLHKKLHGLIAPQQMAKVLQSVLRQQRNLKLIKLQSLPAAPLVTRNADEKKSQLQTSTHKTTEVYRHGLQLEFEGSYLATLAYLKSLQTLPWEFYWDAVRLEVTKYPQARVTIVVHTLSLTEGWIGV